MLHSLLVPLDGSEFSERTLPLAHELARATGATVHLAHVHVTHTPHHFLSNTQFHYEGMDLREYDKRHQQEERAYLTAVESRMREDAPADSALLKGHVADEIAEYASKVDADLVLITTHGHEGLKRIRVGSVADQLIQHTHLPLLVFHPEPGQVFPKDVATIGHVLVPLDGSDASAEILGPAADLASAFGARITLLHVVHASAVRASKFLPSRSVSVSDEVDEAESLLGEVADSLREDGLRVDTHVACHDKPAQAISEVAALLEADLVAMATHGYGGVKRAIMGSVADEVLHTTPFPLLLQRPE